MVPRDHPPTREFKLHLQLNLWHRQPILNMSLSERSLANAKQFINGYSEEVGQKQIPTLDRSTVPTSSAVASGKDRLSGALSKDSCILQRSLDLLSDLHSSITTEEAQMQGQNGVVLNPELRRTVCQLLETVVLCGLQPYLSPGVGVPMHQRIRLHITTGHLSKINSEVRGSQCTSPLVDVLSLLFSIHEAPGRGLEPIMRDHILPDMVYGLAEISYSADTQRSQEGQNSLWASRLKKTLDEYAYSDISSEHLCDRSALKSFVDYPHPTHCAS